MAFFVFEKLHQKVAGAIVAFGGGDVNGVVVLLDGGDFESEIALDHVFDCAADLELQGLHAGRTVKEQNSFHQNLGVLHFADGLLLDICGKTNVSPVFTHLRMKKILVDGGELFAESLVEFSDDFRVAFHRA